MNKWSIKYSCCVVCGTSEKRHMAKGHCVYCYLKKHHADPKNKSRILRQKHKHYLLVQKPQSKELREKRWFDGLRGKVLARDGHTCTVCGFTSANESQLIVHHIDGNGRGSLSPNNAMANLTTLCRACHMNEHRQLVLSCRFKRGVTRWAKAYDCCIDCGTSERRHNSHGRCVNCYSKYRHNKKDIVSA